ncbi:MAG: hypothetical protein A2Z64_13180 [Betaproteobacteria bacterium RIFCSPLOWO2_02_67_12]|nr:MAG: hypothetical protein A2Z64_13180 [Betaproteobacteria bacterium RIFCSPLOWO2_02_67_12]
MADAPAPQDPFEVFRRLWGPLGVPVPGLAMPTLDPQEVEKRIAELKAVEGWLAMNLNMLRMAIQGLEMQKAALQAMRAGVDAGSDAAAAQQPNPMFWPWSAMQQAMGAAMAPEAKDRHSDEENKS